MVEKSKGGNQLNDSKRSMSNIIPNGFHRNFSSVISNPNEQILSKLEIFQNELKENHTDLVSKIDLLTQNNSEIKSEISRLNARLDEINKVITDNNLKVVYFLLDFFRYFSPQNKLSPDSAQIINTIFKTHKLGSGLNVSDLTSYIDKLWK
ncbi:unnamed protein product [Brachionus calyciflorus]|uniref:Uncharacterized protein n=1 Tax=Brachionus calyciflorus TaxID=104777 RepID=A0A814SVX4_9BILA|nr:unnamed protein product [Brachionus calyciflorus]